MAHNFCLSTLDYSEVNKNELLRLLDVKGRSCFMKTGGAEYLKDGDLIYFCHSEELKEQAILAVSNDDSGKLEALATDGSIHAIILSFNHGNDEQDCDEDEEDEEELKALEILRESKLQYEAAGLLTGFDERALDILLKLQFEVIQVLAFLRGGLVMDTGTLEQQIVEKGNWLSKEIVVRELSAKSPIAAAAGVKAGDIIVCADGQQFSGPNELVSYLRSKPRTTVVLQVSRQGEPAAISLTPDGDGKVGMSLVKKWCHSKSRIH